MQEKRKALGRGLEQLFGTESFTMQNFEKNIVESTAKEDVVDIPLDELRSNPYQPREVFDEEKLNELADSIKKYGVIEPIIVKKSIKGYEIVAGERRTLASKKAGFTTIPAIVRDFSDEEMMSIALLENIQREDLNIIEEANAYKALIDNLNITQEELATRVGKSRSHITNILGILSLPKSVQKLVMEGKISMGHARSLSKLENKEEIEGLASLVITKNLNVRQLEDAINGLNPIKKNPIQRDNDPRKLEIQNIMREKIGTLVKINKNNITIPFDSDKDLERILEILNIDIE